MSQERGYSAFCNYINQKSISLIGLGVSNLPLIQFLYDSGAKSVVVRDLKKKDDAPEVVSAINDGAKVYLGEGYLEDLNEDVIIRSPGIRPDHPSFVSAKNQGAEITCETELFLRFVPCTSIGITGSDGKTTTTTLVSKILEAEGYRVHLGGNIGKSMLPQLADISENGHVSVSELSSFQLMDCKYSPNICIITNLAENHLDWHKDMSEYLDAKKNILRHEDNRLAILNFDNEHTKKCSPNGDKVYFTYHNESLCSIPEQQTVVYFDGEWIRVRKDGNVTPVIKAEDILLPGKHNIENYMAAIGATFHLAAPKAVEQVAKNFGGVEHRIELVRVLNDVKFYNSSIDSSPSRSTAALRSFSQKIIMIAGGYDKNLDYHALGDEICEHTKILILCGATADKIENATRNSGLYRENQPKIYRCSNLDECVSLSRELSEGGDIVILSPASASFDQFKNFEERGKYFKNLVRNLK